MKKLKGRFKSPVNPHQIIHQIPLHNPPIHQQSYNPLTNDHIHHLNQPQTLYTEQELRLIDEVLYLHSLWHRGPPSHSGPTHNPNPFLRPSQTTHFKKPRKPHQVSDKEWPIGPQSTCPPSNTWGAFPARNKSTTRPASEEERARVLGAKVQLKAVESCVPLFRRRNGKNGGGGGSESESDCESDDDDEEEMVEFMEEVFEGNVELREFYVKNCGSGEFYCIICEVLGNNIGRKYKNGVALVQHSISVLKTKKRKAHRAYGRVVCKVLGWDIDDLSSVQSSIGDGVAGSSGGGGLSSEKSAEAEDKSHTDVGTTTVGGVEGNAEISEKTHVEQKDVLDIVEKDEIACMDATCNPSEPKHEGEAKSQINEEHPAVEMRGNGISLSQNSVEQNDHSGAIEKDNVMDINANCAVNEVAHHELAVMGNDTYEELPCLPGEFQIPE